MVMFIIVQKCDVVVIVVAHKVFILIGGTQKTDQFITRQIF